MNYEIDNITIMNRISDFIKKNPTLTFHQVLDMCGCSPVEHLSDVSNPSIGKYGVRDRRKESSTITLSRINKTIRIEPNV